MIIRHRRRRRRSAGGSHDSGRGRGTTRKIELGLKGELVVRDRRPTHSPLSLLVVRFPSDGSWPHNAPRLLEFLTSIACRTKGPLPLSRSLPPLLPAPTPVIIPPLCSTAATLAVRKNTSSRLPDSTTPIYSESEPRRPHERFDQDRSGREKDRISQRQRWN